MSNVRVFLAVAWSAVVGLVVAVAFAAHFRPHLVARPSPAVRLNLGAPITVDIKAGEPPPHFYVRLAPVGEVPSADEPLAGPGLVATQRWTSALTAFYRHDNRRALRESAAAFNAVTGRSNDASFSRAQLALLAMQAAQAAGDRAARDAYAAKAVAAADAIVRGKDSNLADKSAARKLAAAAAGDLR